MQRSYGMLAVSDSGPGLDDQSWAHLYEPFFTSKANGRIWALGWRRFTVSCGRAAGGCGPTASPVKGPHFRIYLPSAGAQFPALPAVPAGKVRATAPSFCWSRPTMAMRTVMANLLKKRGYRVLAALHPKEAMRIAETHGPPDLLISRPEPELAHHLTRIQPQLQVLYLGGYADGVARARARIAAADLVAAEAIRTRDTAGKSPGVAGLAPVVDSTPEIQSRPFHHFQWFRH